MQRKYPPFLTPSAEVALALDSGKPVVALESAVITHGLPEPTNREVAMRMCELVREAGCVPATIGVLEGKAIIGLSENEIERLTNDKDVRKLSVRELSSAFVRQASGGTTVAATAHLASQMGIKVFATGGIGGVHRDPPYDVSADLPRLGVTPLVVVCSGAKSILNLPATIEYLETQGIPVLGYRTHSFPAFFAIESGLKVGERVESPEEIADIAKAHWKIGATSAILVANPVPAEAAIPIDRLETWIAEAHELASTQGVQGQALTPYLLNMISEFSQGETLRSNVALLESNARLAAQIAIAMRPRERRLYA